MLNNIQPSSKLAVGAIVAFGTAAGLTYLYRRKAVDLPPTNWREVGRITEINCYPLKSCAPVACDSIQCTLLGLENGKLRDRVFMIITPDNKCVTGRAHPKIVLIKPKIVDELLILSAPGKADIHINIEELSSQQSSVKVSLWDQEAATVDAGNEVAEWISDYVLGEKDGLRLVYYPHKIPTLPINKFNTNIYNNITKDDVGALHDASSYMLMNKASVDQLNYHLIEPVKPLQFRPNFVVEGPEAYQEDTWKWVRIGDDVILKNVRPCTRCVFTNIDPETALRNPQREPLETLKKNRSIVPNDSPVMGIHLGLRSPGHISVGDRVFVQAD